MKQAKQQSQDLHQTDDFLTTLMKPGHPEKEKIKPPPAENNVPRQVNGRPKMPRVDSFSRFSDPPAPPPQQPLPEKPDALPRNTADAVSPLKRTETEKQKPAVSSPITRESNQFQSLQDAFNLARRELESQGARVKELEALLLQERSARESAEERARNLELQSSNASQEPETKAVAEPLVDGVQENEAEQEAVEKSHELENGILTSETDMPKPDEKALVAEAESKQLHRRLEMMMAEMEEMKQQVSAFKDRAQKAEDETVSTRKSLAEMIETLRRERSEMRDTGNKSVTNVSDSSSEAAPSKKNATYSNGQDSGVCQEPVKSPHTTEGESAATSFAAQRHKQNALEHSSPYASMLGVVLLGVGLMAYLNGWQKMDK